MNDEESLNYNQMRVQREAAMARMEGAGLTPKQEKRFRRLELLEATGKITAKQLEALERLDRKRA